MHILVTGGAGFIGSRLVKALLEAGHEVTAFDNLSKGTFAQVPDEARCIEGDVSDEKAVASVFAETPFDIVFHEAPQRKLFDSQDFSEDDVAGSLTGLTVVLDQCCRHGVKKFIFSSSAAVYGEPVRVPIREEDDLRSISFDGQAKAAAEDCIRRYHEQYGLPYVILRYANVYGEGEEDSVVSRFTRAVAYGEDLTIYGDGEQSRDFIYVDDVVRANLAAMADEGSAETYNIGTQMETTINALKVILLYFTHAGISISYEDARPGDVHCSALHSEKAEKRLNWRPKMKLMPGLMAMYQYFCEREDAK